MTDVWPASPSGSVEFCDDIRQEVTGKVTLVGVYNGLMLIGSPYPVVIPKLAIRTVYQDLPGESTEDVEIRVLLCVEGQQDQLMNVYRIPHSARKGVPIPEATADSRAYFRIAHQIEFSPLVFGSDCVISVRAQRGDIVLRMGSLTVRNMPLKMESAEANGDTTPST